MTIEPEVYNIVKSLQDKGIIDLKEQDIDRMKGTTDGLIYTLSENNTPKYVLKMDHSKKTAFVENFLKIYQHVSLLPKLLYTDSKKEFIVYSYLEGKTHYNRGSKINWMTVLVKELFNHYEKCDETARWGRMGIPRQSWKEFNSCSVELASANLKGILPLEDYYKVKTIIERLSKYEKQEDKYLLHGDTGIHNFIFSDYTLTGIIDPSPMVGPIIYDFTYAFCSSSDDLDLETLFASFSFLNHTSIDKSKLIWEVVLQLYTRIGTCAKIHPHDLKDYLKAWEYWRQLISST